MRRKQTVLLLLLSCACDRRPAEPTPSATVSRSPAAEPAPASPLKVDFRDKAMGTEIHVIAYTSARADETATRSAIRRAFDEIVRLERLMTTWRDDSELAELNRRAGEPVRLSADTLTVLEKSIWAGKLSDGAFDVTYASMGQLWKFGDAAEAIPKPPSAAQAKRAIANIDFRQIQIDRDKSQARIGHNQTVDLGGIAKGYAVDRAAEILKRAGLTAFLVQAGGDLYGAGRKPDGSPWVSGIRDPRGAHDAFFATIELEDRAFSTAGDYARSYVSGGKRYHHIIDPDTGMPASASRSVTIWAPDALVADAIDDAVFILGPKRGLELVEGEPGAGAVIVDAKNQVHVSERLRDKVKLLGRPSDGI